MLDDPPAPTFPRIVWEFHDEEHDEPRRIVLLDENTALLERNTQDSMGAACWKEPTQIDTRVLRALLSLRARVDELEAVRDHLHEVSDRVYREGVDAKARVNKLVKERDNLHTECVEQIKRVAELEKEREEVVRQLRGRDLIVDDLEQRQPASSWYARGARALRNVGRALR